MKTLRSYEPILSQLMQLMARETRFRAKPSLSEIIAEHPRLIVAMSHGSPLSWLPAACLLTAHVCARGGGGRRPIGVMDRFFFHVPGLKRMAHALTQTSRSLSLFELSQCVESGECSDIVVFPEGSNCFFGRPDELQEFRSPKFVELAIQYDMPILVCVHRGSEAWARAIEVKDEVIEQLDLLPKFVFDFLESRLRRTGLFALPLLPKPMDCFEMRVELYTPLLSKKDLFEDPIERREQLRAEAERVRASMQRMLAEIDDARAARTARPADLAESAKNQLEQ